MLITENQNKAIGEYVDLIAGRLGSGRAIHPETAIAAAARLSGSLLLRSFGFDLDAYEPGSVLLSDEANEKGPRLLNLVMAFLQKNQMALDPSKLGGKTEQRGTEPNLTVIQSLELLQSDALLIANRNGISLQQAAEAAALATGFIVKECSVTISGEISFNVAAYGFIEGAKTVPPRIRQDIQTSKKSWYKFW